MNNPIIEVLDAGHGETPIPEDSKFNLGDEVLVRVSGRHFEPATIIAVVPPGYPPEYALHDALKEPRPLMVSKNRKRSITYIVRDPSKEDHHYDWIAEKHIKPNT